MARQQHNRQIETTRVATKIQKNLILQRVLHRIVEAKLCRKRIGILHSTLRPVALTENNWRELRSTQCTYDSLLSVFRKTAWMCSVTAPLANRLHDTLRLTI